MLSVRGGRVRAAVATDAQAIALQRIA